MPAELIELYSRLPVFVLLIARLGGLVLYQPFFAALSIPGTVRALWIVALAALVAPLAPPATPPDTVGGMALAIGGEIMLGAILGSVSTALFVALQMGGMLIAQDSGLNYGQIVDPTAGEDLTVLSMLYTQLGMAVFLSVGGERIVIAAVLDSVQALPLPVSGQVAFLGADVLLDALAASTALALRFAAPAILSLTLVNALLGFLSRAMPQLNVLTVGFALKALLAYVLIAVALPSTISVFSAGVDELAEITHKILTSAAIVEGGTRG